MVSNNDLKYMQRALSLSLKGAGRVNPNPLVGAVLVRDGSVIGEGYHAAFGGDHAEIRAITSASGDVTGATLYVTLEPCNHHGKTPPCTKRIIEEKISRVVIGMKDPNPEVTGNGALELEKAGLEVMTGVMTEQISRVNEVFFKYVINRIPFCTLKTAMTLDGKIATREKDSRWITNEQSRAWVHELRHAYAAVMVGVDTVIMDDPELTDRSAHRTKCHPLRIVVDSHGRIPLTAKVLDTRKAPTVVALTGQTPDNITGDLKRKGVQVITCPEKEGRVNLTFLMKALGGQGIDSVLLEGGGELNFSALHEGIVDKVLAFVAPKIIGGKNAPTPVEGEGFASIGEAIEMNMDQIRRFGDDVLVEAYIKRK